MMLLLLLLLLLLQSKLLLLLRDVGHHLRHRQLLLLLLIAGMYKEKETETISGKSHNPVSHESAKSEYHQSEHGKHPSREIELVSRERVTHGARMRKRGVAVEKKEEGRR